MGITHHKWRPGSGTKTGRVWEIADELSQRLGRTPGRLEVLEVYASEGGNPNTGQKQYYDWRNAQEHQQAESAGKAPATDDPPSSGWLMVSPDGQLTLPPDLRRSMRLDASGKIKAEVVDGELRLRSVPVSLERVQAIMRQFDKGEGSVVDELIRERRVEAERE